MVKVAALVPTYTKPCARHVGEAFEGRMHGPWDRDPDTGPTCQARDAPPPGRRCGRGVPVVRHGLMRRGVTEAPRQAGGITRSRPSRRRGCVTHPAAPHPRGAWRHRPPPATRAGRVSAAMPSGARLAPALIGGPSTTQAWTCWGCPIASSAGRTWAWRCHAMAVRGVRGVGRPLPA